MKKLWWIISGGRRRITNEIEKLILSIEKSEYDRMVRENPDILYEEF